MDTDERALEIIEESLILIDTALPRASRNVVKQLSFGKWALLEMQDLILRSPAWISPWTIIEGYMNLMDQYTLESPRNNYAFRVAYDTAWDVLTELIGGEPPH